jgi:hypothetical protein
MVGVLTVFGEGALCGYGVMSTAPERLGCSAICPVRTAPGTQGAVDVLIAIAGASGGALSGMVVDASSYATCLSRRRLPGGPAPSRGGTAPGARGLRDRRP